MPVIQLTPENLRDEAEKLRKTAEINEDVLSRLDSAINGLAGNWEGDAYNAFKTSYESKRKTFEGFTLDMTNFVNYMKEFADVMENQEKLQTGAAQNLG